MTEGLEALPQKSLEILHELFLILVLVWIQEPDALTKIILSVVLTGGWLWFFRISTAKALLSLTILPVLPLYPLVLVQDIANGDLYSDEFLSDLRYVFTLLQLQNKLCVYKFCL